MSETTPTDANKAERMRMAAEHRAIVQATMQAKRAGKLPARKSDSAGAVFLTVIVTIVVVFGTVALAMRYGN